MWEAWIVIPEVVPASGYVFSGWSPTLDENAEITSWVTYTVVYGEDFNGNGENDEFEDHFTVEFSAWTTWWMLSGQLVWNEVLIWLTLDEAWIEIPEPVAESGYVFGWWSPKTPAGSDIVSTWTVYTVIWKVDANNNWIPDDEENNWSGRSGSWHWWWDSGEEHWSADDEPEDTPTWKYSQELLDAYEFAYDNWITTQSPIENADMQGALTRIAMAKMLSQFCINVLWMTPDETRINKFNDVSEELDAEYDNGVTLAYQLWIMWIYMPNNNFRPFDLVPRWEFATALSRILWWDRYNVIDTDTTPFYQKHMEALRDAWIMSQINPTMREIRWYVMLVLMRIINTEWL